MDFKAGANVGIYQMLQYFDALVDSAVMKVYVETGSHAILKRNFQPSQLHITL